MTLKIYNHTWSLAKPPVKSRLEHTNHKSYSCRGGRQLSSPFRRLRDLDYKPYIHLGYLRLPQSTSDGDREHLATAPRDVDL